MEELLLPALKYKVINYFISYNFKIGNGNFYIINYIGNLESKYAGNEICITHLMSIMNVIADFIEYLIKNKNCSFVDDDYRRLLVQNKFAPVLDNINSVEILTDLLYFFEPELMINNNKFNEIFSKLNQS